MKRILYATALAGAGFVSVAAARPLLTPQDDTSAAAPSPEQTRADALARADRRFDRLDANKDGKLTPDELMNAHGPRGHMPQPGATPPAAADDAAPPPSGARNGMPGRFGQRMFARLDANGDGAISRDEYRAWAGERFDRVDANKDGKIDASERQAARDAMMDRMGRHRPMGAPDGEAPPPPPSNPDAGQ